MNSSIFTVPPTLENDRVQLLPMQQEHASLLYQINDPSFWRFMLLTVDTEEKMNKWVSQAIGLREAKKALPFVAVEKQTNKIVGSTRLFEIDFHNRSCELGSTWYQKEYQ